MAEKKDESSRTLEEIMKQLFEAAREGRIQPVFIGVNVFVSPGGEFPHHHRPARGGGTEPAIEVHRLGKRVLLVTEMPGLSPEKIHVLFRGSRVFVWGKEAGRHYRATARVPAPRAGTEEVTYRHGVLEISYESAEERGEGRPRSPGSAD